MSTLDEQIQRVRSDARGRLAAAATADEVDALRHEVLGRSGSLTALLRELGSVPAEERPALGRLANEVRDEVESAIAERLEGLRRGGPDRRPPDETLDINPPGGPPPV